MISLDIGPAPLETRSSGTPASSSYTDIAIQQLVATATGRALLSSSGPIETAAALWARSLSLATVEPAEARTALTPCILASIGRELFLHGRWTGRLAVGPSGLRLEPCTTVDVSGSSTDPMSWRFRANIPTPDATIIANEPAGAVLHVVYGADVASPWRGRSPLASAGNEGRLLAGLAAQLAERAETREHGQLVSLPMLSEPQHEKFLQAIAGLHGRVLPFGQVGRALGQSFRAEVSEIGFNANAHAEGWFHAATQAVWAAAGIPPSLFAAQGEASGQREAWRRYTLSTLANLGAIVSEEASMKLGMDVQLSFEKLRGPDIQSSARAFKSLRDGGLEVPAALRLVGLE